MTIADITCEVDRPLRFGSSAPSEQESHIARFHLLCDNLKWLLPGTILTAIVLFFALQGELSLTIRVLWLALIIAITAARVIFLRRWMLWATTPDNIEQRTLISIFFCTSIGMCFGGLAFGVVSEENPLTNLLVVMVITGMVATATASLAHMRLMYLLYILPMFLPVAYRLYGFENVQYHWISGLIFIYLIVSLGTSRGVRNSILHSINMRFENRSLLASYREEKKRADIALKRAKQANHAKSKFLAAASHDLRQPLHSLRLFTATLELQTRDTQHKTLVSQIDSSVKSLEDLFNALLDISKLDAGTLVVNKQHVFLDDLLTQIESEFKPLAGEKQLAFNVQLGDHVVYTDTLLLERLIRNIVSNAIRYTSKGRVEVSTVVEESCIQIAISDTGMGIPNEDQARIFDEFVQLDNVERDQNQGIGLGLSIVKRLSLLLAVDIDVRSQEGQGTTFTVSVSKGDQSQCQNLYGNPDEMGTPVDSLFVLIIDDEEEVCLAIEGLLETWGCVVMSAVSGDAALLQLEEIGEIPDVIVSDYRLKKGETGGDAIRRIREYLQRDVPAIILTGDIAPNRLQEIESLGLPMLHKPCEPEALRQLLANCAAPPTDTIRGPESPSGAATSVQKVQRQTPTLQMSRV